MLPDDAWMLGFASDHVAAPKCVCERHCHRSGGDRSAHETRRAGAMDQSEWGSGLDLGAEFLGSDDSEMGPLSVWG
jgi:hypothetical protein